MLFLSIFENLLHLEHAYYLPTTLGNNLARHLLIAFHEYWPMSILCIKMSYQKSVCFYSGLPQNLVVKPDDVYNPLS